MPILDEAWLMRAEETLEEAEVRRRRLSDLSYDLIRACGLAVSALQRHDQRSEELVEKARQLHAALLQEIKRTPEFLQSDEEAAFSEFAEAYSLHVLLKEGKLPPPEEFYNPESFILGLADLIGELKRNVVSRLMAGDASTAMKEFAWMEELFDGISRFEYPRSIARGLKHKLDVDRHLIEDARDVLVRSVLPLERRDRPLEGSA
ncbi:MAG: hypothetical protein ACP5UI_00340 [Thermoprotei archaeon]